MNNNSLHASLLLTKLNRPQMPHDQVERTRLVEWLNHDIDRPLFLVCAPAGFGKSTLLRRWFSGACAVELRGGTDAHHSREAFWCRRSPRRLVRRFQKVTIVGE